jgi:hypothetical protein
MVDRTVSPKGSVSPGGDGLAGNTPINGWAALNTMINAGTIVAGDRVIVDGTRGTYGAADFADFPQTAAASTATGIPNLTNTGGGGIVVGTAQGVTSKACGITFDFRGSGVQAVVDGSGQGTTNATRQAYGMLFWGESMRILWPVIKACKRDYLTPMINTAAGGNQPETLSYENIALAVFGNGNYIYEPDLDGGSAFSRYGLHVLLSTSPMSANHSKHTVCSIIRPRIVGSFHELRVDPGGPGSSGTILKDGTVLIIEDPTLLDPCWGRRPGDPVGAYNAASHGGHVSISGAFRGRGSMKGGVLSGNCQDSIDMVTSEFLLEGTLIQDVSSVDPTIWLWSGTSWGLGTRAGRDGNGVKAGLTGLDGTSPSAWLGTDGTPGGSSSVPEACNIIRGLTIRRVSGYGITNNGTKGLDVGYTEIVDAELGGIGLQASTGNNFVHHSYVTLKATTTRVTVAGVNATPGCIDTYSGTRTYLYNNLLRSKYTAADVGGQNRYEIVNRSAIAFDNSKNVLEGGVCSTSLAPPPTRWPTTMPAELPPTCPPTSKASGASPTHHRCTAWLTPTCTENCAVR